MKERGWRLHREAKGVVLDLEVVWTCQDLESRHNENDAGISKVKVIVLDLES